LDVMISKHVGQMDELYQFIHSNVEEEKDLLIELDKTRDSLVNLRSQAIRDAKAFLPRYKEGVIQSLTKLDSEKIRKLYSLSKQGESSKFVFNMIAFARVDAQYRLISSLPYSGQRDQGFHKAIEGMIKADLFDLAARMAEKPVKKDKKIEAFIKIARGLVERDRMEEACRFADKVTGLIGKKNLERKGGKAWIAYRAVVERLMEKEEYKQAAEAACKIPLEAVESHEIATARSFLLRKIVERLVAARDLETAVEVARMIPEDFSFRKAVRDETFQFISDRYAKKGDFENAQLVLTLIQDFRKKTQQQLSLVGFYLKKGMVEKAFSYADSFENEGIKGAAYHRISDHFLGGVLYKKALETALLISSERKSLMNPHVSLRDEAIVMIANGLYRSGTKKEALDCLDFIQCKKLEKHLRSRFSR